MSDFIPNSFQTPNSYVDRYQAFLTDAEFRVLIYTARRIFGFHKRQDRISLSQYTNGLVNRDGHILDFGCGISSRSAVIKALESLIKYGLIVKVSDNDQRFKDGAEYALQLDSDKVDFGGLLQRKDAKEEAARERTRKARSRRSVSGTNQDRLVAQTDQSVSATNQDRLVRLTRIGQCDKPGSVSATDSQYTSRNPEERPEGKQAAEEESRASVNGRKPAAAASSSAASEDSLLEKNLKAFEKEGLGRSSRMLEVAALAHVTPKLIRGQARRLRSEERFSPGLLLTVVANNDPLPHKQQKISRDTDEERRRRYASWEEL